MVTRTATHQGRKLGTKGHRRGGSMADKAAERIKYATELFKALLLLLVAVGGGTVGLVLGPLTPVRLGLATAGIVGMLVPAVVGWRQHRYIQRLIEEIREDT
jgi:hypothetical protein